MKILSLIKGAEAKKVAKLLKTISTKSALTRSTNININKTKFRIFINLKNKKINNNQGVADFLELLNLQEKMFEVVEGLIAQTFLQLNNLYPELKQGQGKIIQTKVYSILVNLNLYIKQLNEKIGEERNLIKNDNINTLEKVIHEEIKIYKSIEALGTSKLENIQEIRQNLTACINSTNNGESIERICANTGAILLGIGAIFTIFQGIYQTATFNFVVKPIFTGYLPYVDDCECAILENGGIIPQQPEIVGGFVRGLPNQCLPNQLGKLILILSATGLIFLSIKYLSNISKVLNYSDMDKRVDRIRKRY
ncbi:hypothetical protein J4403_01140 [Candidatus Woesearchaeota archaeon]|nr:hypothetical protein [Candidatus Woesearchaeota archaeon]